MLLEHATEKAMARPRQRRFVTENATFFEIGGRLRHVRCCSHAAEFLAFTKKLIRPRRNTEVIAFATRMLSQFGTMLRRPHRHRHITAQSQTAITARTLHFSP